MNRINSLDDTIVAIATAQGVSGIGIVRISGKNALKIADKIFLAKDKSKPSKFKTYTMHYGWIVNKFKGKEEIIDEVILALMKAPKSYTKEDIVEINCHGGIVALRKVLDLVLENGARLAEPGEFTKRAFLSGRIDLTQAEAVLDIIQAKTENSLRLGAEQLKGRLSVEINEIREKMLLVLSFLEASIDFPEEGDVERRVNKKELLKIGSVCKLMRKLLDSASMGRLMREGISVAICGRANVGKSSLLNTLLKEERVIVTSIPGTTRDIIEETLDIKGIPVKIADTAGIIEPRDLVERVAISRAHKYFDKADLILFVLDASQELSSQDKRLINRINGKPTISVLNKIDLPRKINKTELGRHFKSIVEISALKHRGIRKLENAIGDIVLSGQLIDNQRVMISNIRQKNSLKRSLEFLEEALILLKDKASEELIAQSLKDAINCLDEITGREANEDLLDRIFNEFCIGK